MKRQPRIVEIQFCLKCSYAMNEADGNVLVVCCLELSEKKKCVELCGNSKHYIIPTSVYCWIYVTISMLWKCAFPDTIIDHFFAIQMKLGFNSKFCSHKLEALS